MCRLPHFSANFWVCLRLPGCGSGLVLPGSGAVLQENTQIRVVSISSQIKFTFELFLSTQKSKYLILFRCNIICVNENGKKFNLIGILNPNVQTCVPISELPSHISSMDRREKDIQTMRRKSSTANRYCPRLKQSANYQYSLYIIETCS